MLHGIVDRIWVEAVKGEETTDLETVGGEVSETVDILLEYETSYDWICSVPKRDSDIGALTKCFGKKRGVDAYKVQGIEMKQRSTRRSLSQPSTSSWTHSTYTGRPRRWSMYVSG